MSVSLARCTVLGPSAIHKLDASECILDDVTIAEDTQHGCVRFCAIAKGSATIPTVKPASKSAPKSRRE